MKRTFTITITIEETTPKAAEPVDDTQTALTAFEAERTQPTPSNGTKSHWHQPTRWPTYSEGRALHPTNADGRAAHARYGTGRKRHTCSRCGSKGRRLNPKTGVCGLGQLCIVMDKGISDEK